MAIDTWYHAAAVRDGSTTRLFLNGIQEVSGATMPWPNQNSAVNLGMSVYSTPGPCYFDGYLDNVRITKGKALYTANFTPSSTSPTASPSMTRECFFVETSSNGALTDVPIVTVSAVTGGDSCSSDSCKCC